MGTRPSEVGDKISIWMVAWVDPLKTTTGRSFSSFVCVLVVSWHNRIGDLRVNFFLPIGPWEPGICVTCRLFQRLSWKGHWSGRRHMTNRNKLNFTHLERLYEFCQATLSQLHDKHRYLIDSCSLQGARDVTSGAGSWPKRFCSWKGQQRKDLVETTKCSLSLT